MVAKHFTLLLFLLPLGAEGLNLEVRTPSPSPIRGAAYVSGGPLWTWGQGVHLWRNGTPSKIADGVWGEGGCIADMNGDGRDDIVLQRGAEFGNLVWLEAPNWRQHTLDTEIQMPDCLSVNLFGRRGILMVLRGIQVRFYEWRDGKPLMREIYSIYTPSRQAGLALVDIDGDGRKDILCGNYWLQAPRGFDLPWRIYAIDQWFYEPEAASMSLAWNEGRIAAQREMSPGNVGFFPHPFEIKDLWPETILTQARKPRVLVSGGKIFIFEDAADTPLFRIVRDRRVVHEQPGIPVIAAFEQAQNRLLLVTRNSVEEWRYF